MGNVYFTLEFMFVGDGDEARVTGYLKNEREVVVPRVLYGWEVVVVETNSFKDKNFVESIVFPETLREIEAGVFENCFRLKRVVFLNDDVLIDKNTFKGCNCIESINFFAYVYLPNPSIINILESRVSCWDSLEREEVDALLYCFKRKSTVRRDILLSNKPGLINFIIGHKIKIKLEDLDSYVNYHIKNGHSEVVAILLKFKDENFTSQYIEEFYANKNMVDIGFVPPTLKQLKGDFNIRVERIGKRKLIHILAYKGFETNVTIPRTTADDYVIESIEHKDYNNYSPIENLVIEDGISVEYSAFIHSVLQSIVLPNTLSCIQPYTFYGCRELKNIILPESVNSIGRNAFSDSGITSINLPLNITCIEEMTFNFCTQLKSIDIPENVTCIKKGAFFACVLLEEIVFPASLEFIGDEAFKGCTNLKSVTYNGQRIKLGKDVFLDCPDVTFIRK